VRRKAGLAIAGAGGYEGRNAVGAVRALTKLVAKDGIDLVVMWLGEIDITRWVDTLKEAAGSGMTPPLYRGMNEAIIYTAALLDAGRFYAPILLFDATPTYRHEEILQRSFASKVGFRYVGEKPIFVRPETLDFFRSLQDYPIYCNFIETVNPVYTAVERYLGKHKNLRIRKITLWRAGSTGISHYVGDGRGGIQGGSLLDKAPHDLSISVGWAGGPSRIVETEVVDADMPYLLVADRAHPFFLNVENKPVPIDDPSMVRPYLSQRREELPADGFSWAKLLWRLEDNSKIEGNYAFSWFGLTDHKAEREILSELDELGLNKFGVDFHSSFLDSDLNRRSKGGEGEYSYDIREVRLGIVHCEYLEGGPPKRLVCNFLGSKHRPELGRFVFAVDDQRFEYRERKKAKPKDESNYAREKRSELAKVLHQVAQDVFGIKSAPLLSRNATLLVHDALLSIQDKALRKLVGDKTEIYRASKDILHGSVRPFRD